MSGRGTTRIDDRGIVIQMIDEKIEPDAAENVKGADRFKVRFI